MTDHVKRFADVQESLSNNIPFVEFEEVLKKISKNGSDLYFFKTVLGHSARRPCICHVLEVSQ